MPTRMTSATKNTGELVGCLVAGLLSAALVGIDSIGPLEQRSARLKNWREPNGKSISHNSVHTQNGLTKWRARCMESRCDHWRSWDASEAWMHAIGSARYDNFIDGIPA